MKRAAWLSIAGAVVLIAAGVVWWQYVQYRAEATALTADSEMDLEGKAFGYTSIVRHRKAGYLSTLPLDQSSTERGWKDVEQMMRLAKASPDEISGVLKAAREKLEKDGIAMHPAFYVPIYAREGWAGPRRVWVIGVGWGVGRSPGGIPEGPGHIAAVVVDPNPPYGILGSTSCC